MAEEFEILDFEGFSEISLSLTSKFRVFDEGIVQVQPMISKILKEIDSLRNSDFKGISKFKQAIKVSNLLYDFWVLE